MADQGPLKRGGSRQGIYALTASGRFLFHAWGDVSPDVLRQKLREAVRVFKALLDNDRSPDVPENVKLDPDYSRSPPPGTLILSVYSRALDQKRGEWCACDERVVLDNRIGVRVLTAYDHLWIMEEEWKAMIPASAKKGDVLPVPAAVVKRVSRFHLVDNTRGEPGYWKEKELQRTNMTLKIDDVSGTLIKMRLDGEALLASDADAQRAKRGFDVSLIGYVDYDVSTKKFRRFDLLAIGTRWGSNPWSTSRPGRTPLGIVFELTRGDSAADRLPPLAARDWRMYLTSIGN